jgi:DNA-directed RNA polymerase specialized sigma24 family protein
MSGTAADWSGGTGGDRGLDVVSRLEREWVALRRPLTHQLLEWGRRERALARFRSPEELVRFLRTPGCWAAKDATLGALLARARAEPLAGQVVLEAILPGLKRTAERVILDAHDREELWQLLLACAWEQIHSYPLERRPSRIAANLILDTRRRALDEFKRERLSRSELPAEPLGVAAAAAELESDVEGLLDRAVAADAITRGEAELILRTRIDRLSVKAVADRLGLPYITAYMRRQRAERRLLLFLGHRPVKNAARKAHCSSARVVGDGLTGSAGGGAVTHPKQRR